MLVTRWNAVTDRACAADPSSLHAASCSARIGGKERGRTGQPEQAADKARERRAAGGRRAAPRPPPARPHLTA